MNKAQIFQQLRETHQNFVTAILNLSDDAFTAAAPAKWSAGQQLEHICKSVRPLVKALQMPATDLIARFGASNRPSKSYDGLVLMYQDVLKNGATASGQFLPQAVMVSDKIGLVENLLADIEKLIELADAHTEEAWDNILLPHPILSSLTLREMLYFMAYHVSHHQKTI